MSSARIAILRLSSLGDVTLVLAAVRAIQDADPSARITWITSPAAHELLEGIEGVELLVVEKPRHLEHYRRIREQLRGRRFDVLLAMQASLRTNAVIPLIPAPDKVGFDRERARDGQWLVTTKRVPFRREHLLDSFLSFVRTIGLPTGEVRWDLPIDERHERLARTRVADTGSYFVVHPFSSKPERDWPVERYAVVIEAVKEGWGLEALVTGGPSPREIHQGRLLEDYTTTSVINLIGQTSPKELAALLRGARFVLAPDTSAVHIATALGTPVVGLYAVAPSWLSGPYRSMEWVVDRHAQAAEELLGVDVDSAPWRTRVHSDRAMRLISVDDVIERTGALLEKLRHEGTD